MFAVAVPVAATGVTPAASAAATVTVNTTTDLVQTGDGFCSLREATLFANGNTAEPDCAPGTASGTTTIVVPSGTYTLRGGPLSLIGSARLAGAGAGTGPGSTTIDAAGHSQVLSIPSVDAHVTISDMTITGGVSGQVCAFACTPGDAVDGVAGGGITTSGTLALERVIVSVWKLSIPPPTPPRPEIPP